jgi:hypothetical protein
LEWQIEHYFVAQQRLEVDKVALQPASEVIIGFDARIDEQLLDIDLKLTRDFTKAPHAFPTDLDRRCAADQHSLDDRFQPKIELDRRSRGYADHRDSQVRRCIDGRSNHPHCARATAQFVGVEDQT